MEPIIVILGLLALTAGGAAGALLLRTRRLQTALDERSETAPEHAALAARLHEAEARSQTAEARSQEAESRSRDAEARTQEAEARASRARDAARAEVRAELVEEQQAGDAERRRVAARFDEERKRTEERLAAEERRLRERSEEVERRSERVERRDDELSRREERVAARGAELDARVAALAEQQERIDQALERVAGLTREQAQAELLAQAEERARSSVARRVQEIEESARERAEATAKNIISMAIQRYAGEYICERTVSVVNLPSDELKGRIIGREGRNIRALEQATGVDFIIDDTPDCIVISAFNPIRREVAKAALEAMLEDGRIHPGRIEQVVKKAESDFHKVIRAAGQEAADEVGVTGVHPEVLKLIGALKYRTSYGQNQWQHALEVSFLCGMMAAELGLDVKLARRAGLLHDIGKVLDQTAEGSHALVGAEFARKHGERNVVINAIASHHEEVPQETVYACLAQAADAISGARPGARREMMQTYAQRLDDLERISNSFPGVERSFAVQAGREVRILVENSRVGDEDAVQLSREIAQKIEGEMSYPGQIKVTVIRETRVVQYAR